MKIDQNTRISAPLTILMSAIIGGVPLVGGYYKFEHRLEQTEARAIRAEDAITKLQAANAATDLWKLGIDLKLETMVSSQGRIEKFIEDLRDGRITVRVTGGRRQP